ncbi:MAG: very short patch repair endonuclease [Candidatus Omnitrophica bacterium]|nr:very short patch repair endonuclease [Candidatus Omnitrophota bacterium]
MARNESKPIGRSENMARIRATENAVEIMLRKELWRRGYRYRKNDKSVFGKPDIVMKSRKVAIFCDSKFWHGIEYLKDGKLPATNTAFWREKLTKNINRDKLVNRTLRKEGWTVIRLYDKNIRKDAAKCADKIENKMVKKQCP